MSYVIVLVIVSTKNILHGVVHQVNLVESVAVKPVYTKNRNPIARDLKTVKYRPRIKPNKKKVYVRENNKFKFVGYE